MAASTFGCYLQRWLRTVTSDIPDPDSIQMVLVLDPSCRVPNRLPQGLLMVDAERRDSLLEFHAHRWGACMHGAWHLLVIHG